MRGARRRSCRVPLKQTLDSVLSFSHFRASFFPCPILTSSDSSHTPHSFIPLLLTLPLYRHLQLLLPLSPTFASRRFGSRPARSFSRFIPLPPTPSRHQPATLLTSTFDLGRNGQLGEVTRALGKIENRRRRRSPASKGTRSRLLRRPFASFLPPHLHTHTQSTYASRPITLRSSTSRPTSFPRSPLSFNSSPPRSHYIPQQ